MGTTAPGQQPPSYLRNLDRLLCEVKQPFALLPGDRAVCRRPLLAVSRNFDRGLITRFGDAQADFWRDLIYMCLELFAKTMLDRFPNLFRPRITEESSIGSIVSTPEV